ncbi:MAG: cobaltochelatase subunit CobN, partial [Elainellaceae cyanobacterium]
MHRLAAIPGGWTPDQEGVIFVEQTPAPIVVLTAADTDIQTLASAHAQLPADFPAVRAVNLLQLQQPLTIDAYADAVLASARAIVVRLLGGRAYWPYGLEVVREVAQRNQASLMVIPGDDRPDPNLMSHSTVPLAKVNQLWRYFTEGGVANGIAALQFIADVGLGTAYQPAPPRPVPQMGHYGWKNPALSATPPAAGAVGILFYRAHYLSGNTAPIDALCAALSTRGLQPVPVFVASLRDSDIQAQVLAELTQGKGIQALLNTTSFAIAQLDTEVVNLELWRQLDVPVIQVILSGGTQAQWESQWRGLSPRDIAMNVALPEVDGRIISRAVSFKSVQSRHEQLEVDVVGYEPVGDRVEFVADLAANWVRLRQTPPAERRVALILANYPNRDGRLANGVGLDTPASCVNVLRALRDAGYRVEDIPATGDDLMARLTQGVTNDSEAQDLRPVQQSLSGAEYGEWFSQLSPMIQQAVGDRWNSPPQSDEFPIAGLQLGHVFVGIQPSRGYDHDPALNYHSPDLEPPHAYLAFYQWLRHRFGAQAVIHLGKHGNLEWLPGKSLALSATCYPEVALGAMPHLYPFIVNDPGEGSQAKRRAQAVIVDHLTPPLTRAELYGGLQQLEGLIDEYYEAQSLDPTRLPVIRDRITTLFRDEHLQNDLGLTDAGGSPPAFDAILRQTDGYLCELKEAQIRDGLHILGQCPEGRQLRDLLVAIARHPNHHQMGLTRAIAAHWHLDLDPLTADPTQPWHPSSDRPIPQLEGCHTLGDVITALEHHAATLVEPLLTPPSPHPPI